MNRRLHLPTALCIGLLSSCGNDQPPEPATAEQTATAPSTQSKPPAAKTDETQAPTAGPRPAPPDALNYPRDKDRVLAEVHGRTITLEAIVNHIDSRSKGFKHLVSSPLGQLELQDSRLASWVRQYADVQLLEAETRRLDIKGTLIRENQGQAYLAAFTDYQRLYEERNNQPFPTSTKGFQFHRRAFQKLRGLGLEVEGLLNTLVPDELDRAGVIAFYKRHSEPMNGYLKISQIFVNTRDKQTGALFTGERMSKAKAKIHEISRLLSKDGRNFELIATSHSEDKAARVGGVLNNLHRFDPRMPANFCRTAWGLRNGKWTGPVETPFGTHFIKRIEWMNTKMIVNPDPDNVDIRHFVRSHRKETLLFKLREASGLVLRY